MAARETHVTIWESTLSAALAAGATTISVTDTTDAPAVPFYAVIDPGNDAKREVVLVDGSKTSTSLTLSGAGQRGLDGTSDVAHDPDAVIGVYPVPGLWTDINDRVDANNTLITTGDAPGHTHIAAYVPLGAAQALVTTSETTTSTTFTDLATVGPSVTVDVPASGRLLVLVGGRMNSDMAGANSQMSFALSGANTNAAGTSAALVYESSNANDLIFATHAVLLTGLTAGATTITAKYATGGSGTSTFSARRITAVPL